MKNVLIIVAILLGSLTFVPVAHASCIASRTYLTLIDTWCNGPNLTITKAERNSTLENSTHPKLLANTAKHFAFTRCGEANLYRMVDAQLSVVEAELLAGLIAS